MGNLLWYGVLTSLFVVLMGTIFYLLQHGNEAPSYKQFLGEPKRLSGTLHFNYYTNCKDHFSIIGYILERDYLYILITLIVLSVILSGL